MRVRHEMENRTSRDFTTVRVPIRFLFIDRRPRIRIVTNIRNSNLEQRAISCGVTSSRVHPLRLAISDEQADNKNNCRYRDDSFVVGEKLVG